MPIEEFYLETEGKNRISLRRIHNGNKKVLIICPGFFQSKNTPTFRSIAESFSGSFDVVSVDMRGHGSSSGLYTFGAREELDMGVIVKHLRKDYEKIGIIGFSLSGLIAVNYASINRGIDSLALICCPAAFDKIRYRFWGPAAIKTGLRGLERGAGVKPGNPFLKKKRPIELISKLSPIPVLLIHGGQDPIIDVKHSEELYIAAEQPKRLAIFKKGGHAEELFRQSARDFTSVLMEWFQNTL